MTRTSEKKIIGLESSGFEGFCYALLTEVCNFKVQMEPKVRVGDKDLTPDLHIDSEEFSCYCDAFFLQSSEDKDKSLKHIYDIWNELLNSGVESKYFRVELLPGYQGFSEWKSPTSEISVASVVASIKHLLQKFDNVENWKRVWAGRRCDSLINGMIKREGNHRDEWPVGNILDPYSPYSFRFYPSDPSSLTYLSSVFLNPHWKVWKAPKRSGGWEVVMKLVPISPESKSFGGARSSRLTFGVGPARSVSYSYPLVRRIKEKARKYGDLDSKGSSILVFVHSRGMGFSSDLVKEFLYGHFSGPGKTDTSNSLWDERRKEKGSRVWGVWAFQNLQFPLRSREVETKGCLFLSPLVSFHQGNLDRLRKAGFLDHQHGILIERPDSRDKFEVKIVTPQSNADNVWAPPLKVPNYREGMKTLFEKAKSGLSGAISSPAEELLGDYIPN